jgi:Holliday junction resolvase
MSSPAQTWSAEAEREVLEGLRPQYERQGFTFTIAPDRASLPEFLGSYVPDAIAQKGAQHIAIEVKRTQSPPTQAKIRDIRRLFEGHPEWQFQVVYAGSGPLQSVTVPRLRPKLFALA